MRALIASVLVGSLALVWSVPPAEAQGPPCRVDVDKTASPAQIQLGQTVEVTLNVSGACPSVEEKADVMLIIDTSLSMGWDGKLEAAKRAAITFVQAMDPAYVRIGLITFFRIPVLEEPLTTDQATLIQTIQGLALDRGTNLVDALEMGRRTLTAAGVRPDANRVIVFITDGRHQVTVPPLSDLDGVIAGVRTANIEVFSVGIGFDADENTLRRMATSPTHFFLAPTSAELEGILTRIAGQVRAQVLISTARVTDEVPANMTYVVGSGRPFEPSLPGAGQILVWDLANVRDAGVELKYTLQPQEVGIWPTNVRADIAFTDGNGNRGTREYPVPRVEVLGTTPPPSAGECVCRIVRQRVPDEIVQDILAHPELTFGWMRPLDEGKPRSPVNPPRRCLTLRNIAIDYHPTFNPPIWRVGCLR